MGFDPWTHATITQGDLLPVDPLYGSASIASTGGYATITQGYPNVPQTATLSQFDQPGYRLAKLFQGRPPMREIYGYGERWAQTDQESTRVFDVPFSSRKDAVDWWLGYSYAAPQVVIGGVVVSPFRLSRVLPDVHPKWPWLFASEVKFIEPKELAIVQDPTCFIDVDPNDPTTRQYIPMIFYASKVPGGYAIPGAPEPLNAVSQSANITAGSTIVSGITTAPLSVEMQVSGNGIPAGATISSINGGSQVTLNLAALTTATAVLTFTPVGPPTIAPDLWDEGIARYAVTYRPMPYTVMSDNDADATGVGELSRFVERQVTYSVRSQPVPSTVQYKFSEGPYVNSGPVPGTPQKLLPGAQWKMIWHHVPDVPLDAVNRCIGRVNDSLWHNNVPGWPSFPPETLLCQSPITQWHRSARGLVNWTIIYTFDRSPDDKGWNAFLGQNGKYYRAGIGGDYANSPLFDRAPFNDLFKIPQTVQPPPPPP